MTAIPMMPEPAGRARPAACRGTPGRRRTAARRGRAGSAAGARPRTDGATAQAARRVGDWRLDDEERRRPGRRGTGSGTEGQPAASVERLAEPREHRRQAAAARRRRSVGPVSGRIRRACTRASVLRSGLAPVAAPESSAGARAWRRRAIDQPASDRPASWSVTPRSSRRVTRDRSATRDGRSRRGVVAPADVVFAARDRESGRSPRTVRDVRPPQARSTRSRSRPQVDETDTEFAVRGQRRPPGLERGGVPTLGLLTPAVCVRGHPSRHRTRRRRRRSAGGARPRDTSAHGWSSRMPDSRRRRRAGRGHDRPAGGAVETVVRAAPRPFRHASAAGGTTGERDVARPGPP